jgi:ABC-2 type transport system permease protein
MVPALGQGLLISSLARNQFLAAQIALILRLLAGFHAVGLSVRDRRDASADPGHHLADPGTLFRFDSLKTVFLAGDIWAVFLPNLLAMAAIGALFFLICQARHAQEPGVSRCSTQ